MLQDSSTGVHALLKVSVAMCTYNGARFLSDQLRSIQSQTVQPDELVVCDDDSQDNTLALLDDFAKSVSFPVVIIRNPIRLGHSANFGKCLSHCTKDIVVLTDQDDLWMPDRIEATRTAFMWDPLLQLTYADAPLIDDQGKQIGRSIFASLHITKSDRMLLDQGNSLISIILRYSVIYGATIAIRASAMNDILPVPETWSHDEWIALSASALGNSSKMPPVMSYRQHASQVVGAGVDTLQTNLTVAKNRGSARYEFEHRHFRIALSTVKNRKVLQPRLLHELEAKTEFCRKRLVVHSGGIKGLATLLMMLVAGTYTRYAAGSRSAVKDFLVAVGWLRSSNL